MLHTLSHYPDIRSKESESRRKLPTLTDSFTFGLNYRAHLGNFSITLFSLVEVQVNANKKDCGRKNDRRKESVPLDITPPYTEVYVKTRFKIKL